MAKINIEKTYFYLASLITLVITIAIVIGFINNAVQYFLPFAFDQATMPERSIRERIVNDKYGPIESREELNQKLEEVTQEEIEAFRNRQVEAERRQSLRSMLGQLLSLCFVVPLYLFHYRRAARISSADQNQTDQ